MGLRTAWGCVAGVVVLLQIGATGVARADNPPAPAPPPATVAAPTAEEESARRYEDAVRADAQGKLNEAKQLAQQGLALSPHGPYAPSLQRLLDRIAHEELDRIEQSRLRLKEPQFAARASPAASKVSLVLSGTLAGIIEGLLVAGAANSAGPGIAGGALAGLAVGLAVSLVTMSDVSDPAVPAHLTLGWLYGVTAGLSIGAIAQSGTGILAAGAIGLPIGALVGTLVGTSTDVTEGDAAAADILMVHLSAIPLLFAAAASPDLSPQAVGGILLAGATLGVLAGELLNQDLHWSEGRWGAIGAIGGLGALVGLLVCVAASASGDGAFAVVGAFDALGLVIGVIATQGLWDEAPRGYHFPSSSPPAAQNALPPIQGPPGRAPTVYAAPLATFPFSL